MAIVFETEKDLETLLMEDPEIMREELDLPNAQFYSQFRLGAYGIADIVALDADRHPGGLAAHITIIELKNVPLALDHIVQVARYKAFFERDIDPRVMHLEVSAILIGPKTFSGSENVYLFQSIPWLRTFEFSFCARQGLNLKEVRGWGRDKDDGAITTVLDFIEDAAGEEPEALVLIAANEAAK